MSGMNMLTISTEWADAITAWDEELRSAGRSKETRYTRTYHLRRFGHDHPRMNPWNVDRETLTAWMARHDWQPETRRSYISSLRTFYAWAHASGRVRMNPAFSLPKVKVPRAQPRPAPNDVVDDGLRNVDLRVRLMILILAFTGMRRGEVARLHTDWLERDLNGWYIRATGKGGHTRIIPIEDKIASALRLLPRGFVFPGQVDGHLSASYVGKLVSRALAPGWTAHTLRHRYATLVYSVERDIRAVQELLGHASVKTTQIYTFVPDEARRRASLGASIGLTAA